MDMEDRTKSAATVESSGSDVSDSEFQHVAKKPRLSPSPSRSRSRSRSRASSSSSSSGSGDEWETGGPGSPDSKKK